MYVNVGTVNGILFRVTLDKTSGQLSDKRARFLGTKPVKLFNVKVGGQEGLLALSSRSWLCYNNQGRFTMMPISYVPLEFASGFRYIVIWSCFVTANSLPFFTDLSNALKVLLPFLTTICEFLLPNKLVTCLINLPSLLGTTPDSPVFYPFFRYSPRKMLIHPNTQHLLLLETDNDTYPLNEKLQVQEMMKKTSDDPDIKMEDGTTSSANESLGEFTK